MLGEDGKVRAFGKDDNKEVTGADGQADVKQVAVGWDHIVLLRKNGSVLAFGNDGCGWTGKVTGCNGQVSKANGQTGVAQVAAGAAHTVLLGEDGKVRAVGDDGSFGGDGRVSNANGVDLGPVDALVTY